MDEADLNFYGNALQFAAVVALAAVVEFRALFASADMTGRGRLLFTFVAAWMLLSVMFPVWTSVDALMGIEKSEVEKGMVAGFLKGAAFAVMGSPFVALVLGLWKPNLPWRRKRGD